MSSHGRRRSSSTRASSAEEGSRMIQPPDLGQDTALTKSEWLRIQGELDQVHKDERMREVAQQMQALHLQSQEAVKLWPNTIASQKQKEMEAKKIREEIAEEKRKLAEKELTKYQKQQRKKAIEKAQSQLFYQTDRVKGLHGAFLLTEVLKEREAQIELKQRMEHASNAVDKEFLVAKNTRDAEASRQEQEKALQKRFEIQAVAKELDKQVEAIELVRKGQKMQKTKDGEETQRLLELHRWEQKTEEERQAKLRRDLMHAHKEYITNRDLVKAADAQKQDAEEEQRKLFLSAKQNIMKLREDKEKELFREAQMHIDKVAKQLPVLLGQTDREERRIAKVVAQQEANQSRQQWEEREKNAKMLESIAEHRELMRREKEQRHKSIEQDTRDSLQAKKEADRMFSEEQQLKTRRMKDDRRKLQYFNATQTADKLARGQQLRREEREFEVKNEELMAEEENRFQQYAQHIIRAAAETERNVFPLRKAARRVRPSHLVQDASGSTQKSNQAKAIQEAKQRLGFSWF
ncbi:hypothetical protein VZT92_005194 [Zoarces viviparus]|uniref:Trichohyalin-plectin-homology domain-containing protein n=1 Tax=Zoarces viviparus TaxID=48416 RepID=A0AAW1FRT8_ZOAVI